MKFSAVLETLCRLTFIFLCAVVVVTPLRSQDLSDLVREPVTIPKFEPSPVIDGKLDEATWKQGAILSDLIQTWTKLPNVIPLSYVRAVEDYKAEYKRRATAFPLTGK